VHLVPGLHIARITRIANASSVPVLEHNGDIIQGSSQILDYLDARYPHKPLMPADRDLANRVRGWENRLDSIAGPAVRTFLYHFLLPQRSVIVPMLTAKQTPPVRWLFHLIYSNVSRRMRSMMKINQASAHQAMDDLDRILSELRQIYANQRFLVGDTFTRADLTACALLAPLYQPSGYGMKWPELDYLPDEMADWLKSHESALRSLALRYEQNR